MQESAFSGHPLWAALDQAEQGLAAAEEWVDQRAYAFASCRWLVNAIRSHQDPADVMPYPAQILDGLNNNLAQINNGLTNANSTKDLSHLQSQSSYIDSATHQVATLPPVANRDPAKQASRTFVEYRESVEESLSRLHERAKEIEDLLAEHQSSSEEGAKETEGKIATLRASIDQLQAKITQDEGRLDTALTTNSEAFIKAQTEREKEFQDSLEVQNTSFEERASKIETSGQEHLEAIQKLHDDVEKVSGKAATAILAKDYGAYSTREWVSGVVAYVLGFVALISLGVYLIHTVSTVSKDEHVSWQYVALKLGLTATAIAAATVAFQFGGHALSRANTNKRVQLELGTIGTFLADVDDEQAVQAAKVDFVNRMFGRAWDEKPSAASPDVVNVSALGRLADAVSKLAANR